LDLLLKDWGKEAMSKMNCEKGESYFFHMTTPCTIGKSGGIGQVGFKSGPNGH
jgi:hypothetical protein